MGCARVTATARDLALMREIGEVIKRHMQEHVAPLTRRIAELEKEVLDLQRHVTEPTR